MSHQAIASSRTKSPADRQRAVNAYKDQIGWLRMHLRNCAWSGHFSADRIMQEHDRAIWHLARGSALPVGKPHRVA